MTKNILLCLAGIALGFIVGVLLANQMASRMSNAVSVTPASNNTAAPPLDPSDPNPQLPPGHPNIDGSSNGAQTAAANPNGVAATSAQAQAAMEAADAKPKDFDLQMKAAATFYQASAFDKAIIYLQRAVEIKPRDFDALTALGNTKYDSGDFTGAASLYERALAVKPKDADVQTDLGNTYFRRTPPDYQRAITEYRKALAIDPKHENALQNMASAALELGDKTTARDAVDKLASINPSNPKLNALRSNLEMNP